MDKSRNRTFQIGQTSINVNAIEAGLYIVATPIGNLGDMTIRALETLASADIIACEDTRNSRKLLDRFAISSKLIAYHEHNAEQAAQTLLNALDQGQTIALICDAGTPLISDPGYRIVNQARAMGHRVIPIPGPSALLTALMAAGLPTDQIIYGGFLPHKDKARRAHMDRYVSFKGTLAFFESPNRLMASLKCAAEIFGPDCTACVCRELTKLHEEFAKGTLAELNTIFSDRTIKGEIVLLIASEPAIKHYSDKDISAILSELAQTNSTGQAATKAAELTGLNRKELYQKLLDLKHNNGPSR